MKTNRITTTTTTVTTTTRVPRPRLVKRVRTLVVRTANVKLAKASVRRRGAAIVVPTVTAKPAKVLTVTTARTLPAPKPEVSELTVKERQRLRSPR